MKLTKALRKRGRDWAIRIRLRRNPPFTLRLQFASGAIVEIPGLWGDLKVEEVQWLAVDYNIVDSDTKCSLVHAGALLEPSQTLRDYGIESDTTISIYCGQNFTEFFEEIQLVEAQNVQQLVDDQNSSAQNEQN